jgi:hypothetical protein
MAHYIAVNQDKKFIAFYSPKCGQTTLTDWFIASLELGELVEHAILAHYMITPADVARYPTYRKVFFIRDPFHRLVSFYCGIVVRETPLWCFADDEGKYRLEGKTFAELVEALAVLAEQARRFQHHLQPQIGGVEDVEFDDVVPIEQYSTRIGRLNQKLSIDCEPRRLNVTQYTDNESEKVYDRHPEEIAISGPPRYEYFYSRELIDVVRDLYREDIDFYEAHSGPTMSSRR